MRNMRRRRTGRDLAAVVAAVLATAPARAAETPPPAGLLEAVAAWAAAAAGLALPAEPPRVAFTSPAAMAALRAGAGEAAAGQRIVALYDTRDRTIHLPAGWTGETAAEMSVLVHEMVHHLQAAAGQRHGCPAERERAAYAAQARWLERSGGSLAAALGIDPMTLLVLTTCGM